MNIQILLIVLVILLFLILVELSKISSRLKDRFHAEKERDYKW